MRTIVRTVTVALLLTSLVAAQDDDAPRVVKVTGSAEIKVLPDEAVLRVGVENQNVNARTAKANCDAAAQRVLGVVRGFGIDSKDVQTSYLALRPQFDYRKGMRLVSYIAVQTLTIRVADLGKVDDLIAALVKAGSNRIDDIDYNASSLRKIQDQAREMAVHAAREKAQALAKALGQDIGKAHTIEEIVVDGWSPFSANTLSAEYGNAKGVIRPTTSPGQLTVRASVTVSFDLI